MKLYFIAFPVLFTAYCFYLSIFKKTPDFFLYFISISPFLLLLELLNKGVCFKQITNFPKDIRLLLEYLFLKFIILSFVTGGIIFGALSFLTNPNLLLLVIFIICFSYSSVVFYISFMLLVWKKLQPELLEMLAYTLFVSVILAIVFFVYYIISYFVLIPIFLMLMFIHFKWIPIMSELISSVSYQILENSK